MSWRQRQKELDQLNRRLFRWFSLIAGTFMGAFLGWLIVLKTGHEEVLFRFEIELTVAAVCGLAASVWESDSSTCWKISSSTPMQALGLISTLTKGLDAESCEV